MKRKKENVLIPVEKKAISCLGGPRNLIPEKLCDLSKEVHDSLKMQNWLPTFNSDLHFIKTECGPAPPGNMRAKNMSYTSSP